jgi:hypothetical protein
MEKYLKYKQKYIKLILGGADVTTIPQPSSEIEIKFAEFTAKAVQTSLINPYTSENILFITSPNSASKMKDAIENEDHVVFPTETSKKALIVYSSSSDTYYIQSSYDYAAVLNILKGENPNTPNEREIYHYSLNMFCNMRAKEAHLASEIPSIDKRVKERSCQLISECKKLLQK